MRVRELPEHGDLEEERGRLTVHLEDAFRSTSRAGGISWSEAEIEDMGGSHKESAEARARDRERHWMELVDDPEWDPDPGIGGFSFLDAIGFRYYLPAWMMRVLLGKADGWALPFRLTLAPRGDGSHRWTLDKWSALDRKQKLFIARFVNFMIAAAEAAGDADDAAEWRKAKDTYWGSVE